ncbi:type II toxin-antitoxin system VapC family toxin [Paracoccus lichenicola]|nr:type II toxin-antitoxin system VapC family toxin [Paracoccus lichenicola]
MLVLDASALVGWVMPDERGINLPELAALHADIVAPWLLWAELRNILIVNERRGRIPPGTAEQIIDAVEALGIVLDIEPAGAVVLDLARRHRLTIYDALYLELALRQGATLASLDDALLAAAKAEAVPVAN